MVIIMKRNRLIALILLAGMLAGSFSCGDSAPGDETSGDQSDAPDATTASDTTSYLDTLPKENLSGYTFRVIGQSTNERQNFYTDEKDGDVINDAIHERDVKVSERLGVTFEFIALDDRNEVASRVQKTVLADDPAYEMAITAMSQGINTMISAGVLLDLGDLPYVTLDGGLWDRSIHDRMTFGGRQYFTTGVISAQFSQSPVACLFNKRLAGEYGIDDVYQTVLDGKWTIDLLSEYMKKSSHDLDGNGTMDVNDFYGFSLDPVFGNVLYASAGYDPITEKDGVFSVDLSDARMTEIIEKCAGIFGNPDVTYHNKFSDGSSLLVFRESRSIFTTCDMLDVQKFRDMADDFGIIPTPKFDESQDYYTTTCTTWLPTGVAVPLNCRDTDKVGLVMETMAAMADEIIVPAVYEVTLNGKVSRDDVSSKMLDIIFDNPSYDFITAFDFGGSGTELRKAVLGWTENWSSTWAKMQNKVENEINSISEKAE